MNSDKFKIPERCESRSYSRARSNSSRGGNFTSSDKNHWQPRCNSVAFNRPANTSSSRQFSGNSSHWNPRSRNNSSASEISFFGEMPTNGRYNENFSTHFNTRHRSMSKNESSHGDWRNQTLPASTANNDDSFGGSNKHFSQNESSRQFNGNQWQKTVGMSNGINRESKENFNHHNRTFSSSSFSKHPQQKAPEYGYSKQSSSNSRSPRVVAFFNALTSRPVTNENTTNCETSTSNGQQMKTSAGLVDDSKSTYATVPNVDSPKLSVNDSNTQDTPVTSKLNRAKAMLRAENKLKAIDFQKSIFSNEHSGPTTIGINSTAEPDIASSVDNLSGLDTTIDATFDSNRETDKESVCSNRSDSKIARRNRKKRMRRLMEKTRKAEMSTATDGEEMSAEEGLLGKKNVRQLCRFVTNTVSLSTNSESVQKKLDDQSKEKSKDDTNNCGITSSMETTRQSRDHIGTSCLSHHKNPRLRSKSLDSSLRACSQQTATPAQKLSSVSLENLKFNLEPKKTTSKRFRLSVPQEMKELLKNRLHKQKYTKNSETVGSEKFTKMLEQDEQVFHHYLVHMEALRRSNKCSYFAEFGSFKDFRGRMNTFHIFHSKEIFNNPHLCYTKQQDAVNFLQTRIDYHANVDGDKDERMIAHFQRCQMAVKFCNRTALLEALAMRDMGAPSEVMVPYEFLNMLFIYTGQYIFP